jgi:hypothetical protein
MERNEIDVGPGYVLSRRERFVEPNLSRQVTQNFVLHDVAEGSERELPGLGETISLTTALDAQHVYWLSYPGEIGNPLLRLVRVDLASGALTVLSTPHHALDPDARIVGQELDTVYVQGGNELLAIDKP